MSEGLFNYAVNSLSCTVLQFWVIKWTVHCEEREGKRTWLNFRYYTKQDREIQRKYL